ncbi:MAG: hypothetical protein ACUVQ1_09085 [Candidatus Kapaibacteriales bacterium]
MKFRKIICPIFFLFLVPISIFSISEDSLFTKFKKFIFGNLDRQSLKSYQIVGIIETDQNDTLEFVLQRIIPDTLRLQVKFPHDNYAITCITSNSGWIVDPTRKIFEPTDLLPEEINYMKSNILTLFSFIDENLLFASKAVVLSFGNSDTLGFKVIDKLNSEISYLFKKTNVLDYYKEVNFGKYHFQIIPSGFFSYQDFKIPRAIQIISNQIKKTNLIIQNINFEPKFERNLFFYKKQ